MVTACGILARAPASERSGIEWSGAGSNRRHSVFSRNSYVADGATLPGDGLV